MNNEEDVKQREHQQFIESLDPSDAAQLENLGHHGIGGALNRDKEEDVSFEHEFKNSALYKMTQADAPGVPQNTGWNAHPLATFWLALSLIFISGAATYSCLEKPIDRQPALVRSWPSVVAKVVNTVVHNSRHDRYDYTFDYQVGEQIYRFTEDGVGTAFDMSEVKYDPKAPTHYFRVPLDAETMIPAIAGCLGLFLGFGLLWDGVAKWRRCIRSDVGPTLACLVSAAAITMISIAFYVGTTANSQTPYSIAKIVKTN